MGRKPKADKVVKPKADKVDRKTYLRDSLVEHIEEAYPETERKFDFFRVIEPAGTRGSFRTFMNGDFKPEDRRIVRDILQDLKKDGILFHIAGRYWSRLK